MLSAQYILEDTNQRIKPKLFDALGVPDANPEMYSAIKGFLFPKKVGKRVRPAGVFQTVRAYGKVDIINALWAALSIELDHNRYLIHDDIEDGSHIRRGEECLYLLYGLDKAVNFGDWLGGKAQRALELEYEKSFVDVNDFYRLSKERREQNNTTGEGQDYEFCIRRKPFGDTTEEDIFKIHRKKTARYTVVTPFIYAAIISGISDAEIKKLFTALEKLGIAFQITDDILDMSGNLTKDWAGDLEEGKRTLHLVRTYHQAALKERELIDQWVGRKNNDGKFLLEDRPDVKRKIISTMNKYGEFEKCRAIAANLSREGLEAVKNNLPDTEGTRGLLNLYEYITVTREK